MKRRPTSMCLSFLAIICLSCGAAQVDLVKTHRATIYKVPSETHELYAVYAFQKGNDFVIYGKVKKTRGVCITPGHVDVAVIGKDGKILSAFGIPIRKCGKKRPGWYGANYRARTPFVVPKDAEVRLAFHGEHCYPEMTFKVANNLAIPRP
ncbi:MAG: hypothetical protein GY854_02920 [Deltaproteobacteria bacterium]|nr:hypothetical protein [Deltaproteobacteria bacterium]